MLLKKVAAKSNCGTIFAYCLYEQLKLKPMEGYEELYDKIQDVTNEMNRFFGLAILNSVPMDKHTEHLVERLQRISTELSETSHELEEHLAWD